MVIDLRSDIVSRPTEAMIEAMVEAARSPSGFGLTGDPTVRRLEESAADKLGKESAVFCPTCTLCNQIAVHLRCRPGESFVAEAWSHVILAEAGAVAALSGAMPVCVPGRRGVPDLVDLERAVRKGDAQRSRTALIVTENTHVYSGGAVVPMAAMRGIRDFAQDKAIPVHLDGARLFNAAAFLGVTGREVARHADSVALSLNKGLGAPIGAILAGDRDFINEAVRVRQMFGGGWRPAGIPAAAGIVALETMIDRMADDHRNARRLAEGLATCRGVDVNLDEVDTNIVLARIDRSLIPVGDFVRRLEDKDILIMEFTVVLPDTVRLVLHHDIGPDEVDRTIETVAAITSPGARRRGGGSV
jgi:threonine aldolase